MKNMAVCIGVDLGGTKIESVLVDEDNNVILEKRCPTDTKHGAAGVIKSLVSSVDVILSEAQADVHRIGVGAAGQVGKDGSVIFSPNLPFVDEPLKEKLEKKLGMPVFVTNDVRAATYAEWQYGAGRGINDLIVVFIGTGIGGGVVSAGVMLEGCTNTAGELGHITIMADGRRCRCPNNGCLEAYAGGWAIAERAKEMISTYPDAGKKMLLSAGTGDVTASAVAAAYRKKDTLAVRIVEETGGYLGAGVTGLVNAYNPCVFILGGGVIEGLPELIDLAEKNVRTHGLPPGRDKVRMVKAALGSKAGAIGAAALARKTGINAV